MKVNKKYIGSLVKTNVKFYLMTGRNKPSQTEYGIILGLSAGEEYYNTIIFYARDCDRTGSYIYYLTPYEIVIL